MFQWRSTLNATCTIDREYGCQLIIKGSKGASTMINLGVCSKYFILYFNGREEKKNSPIVGFVC